MPKKNKVIADTKKFINKELTSLKDNVSNNYDENKKNRENNPFLKFNNQSILKYMALGRSVDAQLGNRMQRIIFYLARVRYGIEATPNLVYINMTDEKNKEISCTLYSVPFDLEGKYQDKGFDPYKQTVYFEEADQEKAKRALKVSSNAEDLDKINVTFNNVPDPTFKLIKEKEGKKIPVDLLYFDIDKKQIKSAHTYEIKMGGNLDTKNAKGNANEVKELRTLFAFLGSSDSSFATCYGMCSDSVTTQVKNLGDKGCCVLDAAQFWQKILPEGKNAITYDQFIDMFQKALKSSKLEQTLKKL